ncbi:hypothetical protein [Arachidicoccus sp.]|jgi:hypothetical protein|uniref:hypothetical protein n=1 Tax=Arachidicoccus sp. TaxID=1872624 RepID=UPI003D23420D
MENNTNTKVVYDFQSYHTPVTRAIYVGVFIGFVTALVNIAYWAAYINMTGLGRSSYVVNIQTLCFGSIIPLVVCGALYAIFTHYLKKAGILLNSALFILAGLWLIVVASKGDYGDTAQHIREFKELVIPIIAIIGISAAFIFPICLKNKKIENMML